MLHLFKYFQLELFYIVYLITNSVICWWLFLIVVSFTVCLGYFILISHLLKLICGNPGTKIVAVFFQEHFLLSGIRVLPKQDHSGQLSESLVYSKNIPGRPRRGGGQAGAAPGYSGSSRSCGRGGSGCDAAWRQTSRAAWLRGGTWSHRTWDLSHTPVQHSEEKLPLWVPAL